MSYVFDIVDDTVSCGFRSDVTATPGESLAGEHTSPLVPELLVLAEHESDFAGTSANVASRHVGVLTDVPLELGHEANAEATDLVVRLALGVKV